MTKKKIYKALWAATILTAAAIAVIFIISLLLPSKRYFLFDEYVVRLMLPPVWCIILIILFAVQTIVVTIMIALDLTGKKDVKSDFIITTLIGLVCLVLACAPAFGGFMEVMLNIIDGSANCHTYKAGDHTVIVKNKILMESGLKSEVYLLSDSGEAVEAGEIVRPSEETNTDKYIYECSGGRLVISYEDNDTGEIIELLNEEVQ